MKKPRQKWTSWGSVSQKEFGEHLPQDHLGRMPNTALPTPEPSSEFPQTVCMYMKLETHRLEVPGLKASSSLQLAFCLPICLHPESPTSLGPPAAWASLFQGIPGLGPCRGASEPLRVSFGLIPTPGKSWTPELPSIQGHGPGWESRSDTDAHRVESPRRGRGGRAASCRPPGYSPSPSARGEQVKVWPG